MSQPPSEIVDRLLPGAEPTCAAVRPGREELQQRRHLALLELVSADLPGNEDANAAFQRLVDTTGPSLELRRASLWLYEPAPHCVGVYAPDALTPEEPGDPSRWSAPYPLIDPRAGEVLPVPIHLDGRHVGELWLEAESPQRRWEVEEVAFAAAVAQLAAQVCRGVENRRVRRELEERDRRFGHIVSSAECLLWEARVTERAGNLDWQIWMIDEASAQRFLPLEVADGETYSEAWYWSKSPEDHQRMDAVSEAAIREGASGYQQEFSCRQADGRVRWLWEDVRIDPAGSGRWNLVGVCTDISARKRAEQRDAAFLRLGEQLNRTASPEEAARILLQVADDLLRWDACWLALQDAEDEHQQFTVVIDEIDGQRKEVPPPGPVLGISPLARRALQEGAFLLQREAHDTHPPSLRFGDLKRSTRSVLVVPIRHRERCLGVLSIQSYTPAAYSEEDLRTLEALADYCAGALERTRIEAVRSRLEEELRQSQKMEAIGRLAGGVAHDFNNMLMVINGYAALLAGTLPADSPSGEAVREIAAAGSRAAALTRQLLAFSRKQMLAPQVLDVAGVLRSLEPMIRRLIGEDIELRIEAPSAVGPVEADPHQLEHALVNLVVNARDAMPEGGVLTLAARETPRPPLPGSASPSAAPQVELSVTDTGVGMTECVRQRIFEPFFTTKEAGKGTGLGLATVFGIVRQSGGDIEVESAPGRGTVFRIYLPRLCDPAP